MNLWTWLINHRLLGILRSYLPRFCFRDLGGEQSSQCVMKFLARSQLTLLGAWYTGNIMATLQLDDEPTKSFIFPWQKWMENHHFSPFRKSGWLLGSRIIVLRFSHLGSRPSFKPIKENNHCETETAAVLDFFAAGNEAEFYGEAPKDQDLRIEILHRFNVDIPFSKLTWQWKSHHFQ